MHCKDCSFSPLPWTCAVCEFGISEFIFFIQFGTQVRLIHSSQAQLKQQPLISRLEETLAVLDFLRDIMSFSNMVPAEGIFKGTSDYHSS